MAQTATFRNKRTGKVRDFTLEEAINVGISQEKFLSKLETQKGIEEIEAPVDPVADLGETERKFAIGLGAARSALADLKKDPITGKRKVKTGPITTRFQKVGEFFGKSGPGTKFRSQLALAQTAIKSAFLGAQQSPAELEGLIDALSDPNVQEDVLATRIESLISAVEPFVPAGVREAAMKGVDEELKKKGTEDLIQPPQNGELNIEELSREAAEIQPLTPVQKIAQTAATAAPIVGSVVGGLTGAFLGAGVASLFTGVLGTAIGTAGGIAFGETLQDLVGIQDETPQEQLKKAAVTTATASALDLMGGALFMGGGALVKQLGKGIFKIGDDIILRAIRPSPSQQRKFLQKTGIELKEFAIDKGLFKKGVEQVDNLIKPLQDGFDDIAVKSGQAIDPASVVAKFDEKITELSAIPNREAQQLAKQLAEEAKLFMNKMGVNPIEVGNLTQLRRTIDNLLPDSKFLQDPIMAGKNRMVRNIYQESIQEATEGLTNATGQNLKEIGQELNKLYNFRGIVEQQFGLGKGTLPIGLIKSITIGGGGAIGAVGGGTEGAITGALIGMGLPALANNPKVISYLARNLPIVGKAVQGLPENQKARIITDAFRRLLTNLGAVEMSNLGAD